MKDDVSSRSPSFMINDSYMAGLIDAIGHISVMSRGKKVARSPVLQIKLPDEDRVRDIQEYFSVGTVYTEMRPNSKSTYRWRVSGAAAQDVIRQVLPEMRIKVDRAKDALSVEVKKRRPIERLTRERLDKYGLTEDDVHSMLDAQGGCCDICGVEFHQYEFHIDHDHKTGTVRGLLCSKCNTAIGFLQDNPDFMRNAANYIEKSLIKGAM